MQPPRGFLHLGKLDFGTQHGALLTMKSERAKSEACKYRETSLSDSACRNGRCAIVRLPTPRPRFQEYAAATVWDE
jgi:hypothetical protein